MRSPRGFIPIADARDLLGDYADLDRLIAEFVVAKHVGSDGVMSVRSDDIQNLARVLNPNAPRRPRQPTLL